MRILYILSGTQMAGGASKSFLTLLEAVRAAGHDVAVVCNDNGGVASYLKSIGVDIFVCPYRFASLPPVSLTARDIVRFVPRFVRDRVINRHAGKAVLEFSRRFRPDIIHENSSVTGIGYYVARRLDLPLVMHIREYADKDFKIYLLNYRRRLRYHKTYPVAITRDLAEYRCNRLGIGREPRVIYNGILDSRAMSLPKDKRPFFLYAGRIEPNKGIEDLIDAYIGYRSHSDTDGKVIKLKIAGAYLRKAFLDSLEQKVGQAGLSADVEWLGECSGMDELYSEAAATIIPSYCEGFGRIPPEAMACGSLCVMRNAGGLKEQLDNGVSVSGDEIALRFTTVEQLEECLSQIADDYFASSSCSDSRFFRMMQRAQTTVGRLYSKKAHCDNFMSLYDEILNQSKIK